MSESVGKVGRPALPKEEKRWKFISTRISEGEYQEIVKAAKESGLSKTKWVRTRLIAAARRTPDKTMKYTVQYQARSSVYKSHRPEASIMADLTILD